MFYNPPLYFVNVGTQYPDLDSIRFQHTGRLSVDNQQNDKSDNGYERKRQPQVSNLSASRCFDIGDLRSGGVCRSGDQPTTETGPQQKLEYNEGLVRGRLARNRQVCGRDARAPLPPTMDFNVRLQFGAKDELPFQLQITQMKNSAESCASAVVELDCQALDAGYFHVEGGGFDYLIVQRLAK